MGEINFKSPIKLEDNGILKYISGGILEQKHRFNVKLINGSINLKAGSKVINPHNQSDSRGRFEVVEVLSDVTLNSGGTITEDYLLLYDATFTNLVNMPLSSCFSGTSYPTLTVQHALFFDETNNIIEETYDGGEVWEVMDYSFPIGLAKRVNGRYTELNKFEGISFIGRTFFLDEMCVAFPNGYNANGTFDYLKSKLPMQTKVVAQTQQEGYYLSASSNKDYKSYQRYLEANSYDNAGNITLFNNTDDNHMYYMNTSNVAEERHEYPVCEYNTNGIGITSLRNIGVVRFSILNNIA